MFGGGERLGDIGPGLGNDGCGGKGADAGDRGQQFTLAPRRLHHVLDLGVELGDHFVEMVEIVQMQSAHERVVALKAALQRPL